MPIGFKVLVAFIGGFLHFVFNEALKAIFKAFFLSDTAITYVLLSLIVFRLGPLVLHEGVEQLIELILDDRVDFYDQLQDQEEGLEFSDEELELD